MSFQKKLFLLISLWLVLACGLTSVSFAVLRDNNILAFDFNAGARPLGLGGAFVGQADDVCAALYNPAGLTWTKGIEVNFKDTSNVSAFQAYPTGHGYTFGLAVASRSESQSTLNYSSNLLIGTLAGRGSALPLIPQNDFTDNIALGVNLKAILSQTVRVTGSADQTATGWDADFGVLWKTNPWLNIGLNSKNFLHSGGGVGAGKFSWTNGSTEPIPSSLVVGLSAKLIGDVSAPFYLYGNELFANLDYDMAVTDGNWRLAAGSFFRGGLEWVYWNTLFLRCGSYQINAVGKSGGGVGLGYRREGWGLDATLATDGGTQAFQFSVLYFPKEWTFVKRVEPEKHYVKDPIKIWTGREDDFTYEETIAVSGEVKEGARVYVNNQEAFVDNQGVFTVYVPLMTGKNRIDIRGEYFGQEIVSFTKKVLRKAKVIIAEEKEIEKKIEQVVEKEEKKIVERIEKVEKRLESKTISKVQKQKLEEEKKQLEKREEKVKEKKEELVKEKEKIEERKEKVEALVTMGVVEVEPEKEFEMEARVTRAELASWLVKAAGLPLPRVERKLFTDVPSDHPMAPYIKVVSDLGIMRGFPDGSFKPDEGLSEEEGEAIFKKFGVIQ